MQKLSHKEDALCSLEKEEKSPKNGKKTLKKGKRIGKRQRPDLSGGGRNSDLPI